MPYCTNRNDIALTANSYCTVKRASGKSIAEDQRTSRFFSDSLGLCKAISMERVVGRMAGESKKRFEAMGGVVSSIGRSITSLHRLRKLQIYQGKLTA